MYKSILFFILLPLFFSQIAVANTASTSLTKMPELQNEASDRFPGDPAEHKAVYILNKADADYQLSILNSIQAMIRKYDDNVDIAVVVIGPGLHILAKKPTRPVAPSTYERIASFAKDYNVRWIACGNTMSSLHWTDADMRPFAEYAEVGAAALMELQEEGFKLLVW